MIRRRWAYQLSHLQIILIANFDKINLEILLRCLCYPFGDNTRFLWIHTYHSRFIPKRAVETFRCSSETPTLYQNYLAMRNTADVTVKPIAVWSQSISGVNAINTLVAFYDIHGRKREVLFFYLSQTPHETIDDSYVYIPLWKDRKPI
jgi:hypothetical protein